MHQVVFGPAHISLGQPLTAVRSKSCPSLHLSINLPHIDTAMEEAADIERERQYDIKGKYTLSSEDFEAMLPKIKHEVTSKRAAIKKEAEVVKTEKKSLPQSARRSQDELLIKTQIESTPIMIPPPISEASADIKTPSKASELLSAHQAYLVGNIAKDQPNLFSTIEQVQDIIAQVENDYSKVKGRLGDIKLNEFGRKMTAIKEHVKKGHDLIDQVNRSLGINLNPLYIKLSRSDFDGSWQLHQQLSGFKASKSRNGKGSKGHELKGLINRLGFSEQLEFLLLKSQAFDQPQQPSFIEAHLIYRATELEIPGFREDPNLRLKAASRMGAHDCLYSQYKFMDEATNLFNSLDSKAKQKFLSGLEADCLRSNASAFMLLGGLFHKGLYKKSFLGQTALETSAKGFTISQEQLTEHLRTHQPIMSPLDYLRPHKIRERQLERRIDLMHHEAAKMGSPSSQEALANLYYRRDKPEEGDAMRLRAKTNRMLLEIQI